MELNGLPSIVIKKHQAYQLTMIHLVSTNQMYMRKAIVKSLVPKYFKRFMKLRTSTKIQNQYKMRIEF